MSATSPADLSALTAVSPVDGRYGDKTAPLRAHFSEYGLIKQRVLVEVRWLLALADAGIVPQLPKFDAPSRALLESIVTDFDVAEAAKVKTIERTTNHDVKAVEYYLKEAAKAKAAGKADASQLGERLEFFHFACTSEDINNLAYSRMLNLSRSDVLLPVMDKIEAKMTEMAHELADVPMLSRTHGQPATPTTAGKEMANVAVRLRTQLAQIKAVPMRGKIAGAVGAYQAHAVACPDADWPTFAEGFVKSLDLEFNAYVTQIEPHDCIAELFDAFARFNTVLLDLCRDMWSYISIVRLHARMPARRPEGAARLDGMTLLTPLSPCLSCRATLSRRSSLARSAPRRCLTRSTRSTSRTQRATSASQTRSSPTSAPSCPSRAGSVT